MPLCPCAGTFLSNAGVTQVFNVNNVETAAWVSCTLGATMEAYETTSQSFTYGKDAPILAGKVRSFADPEFGGVFDRSDASALPSARVAAGAAE